MKKVLLTATVQSHIAQFHIPHIKLLKENGYEVHVAARNNLAEKNGLILETPDKIFDIPFSRSPYSKSNIVAYKQIKSLITENDYSIVHCNTPVGSVITRMVARKFRKRGTNVIYTAHGFHFYKSAPLPNWLIYYPIERILARYTDVLITINSEDFQRAKSFKAKEVAYIPGVGVDTDKFASSKAIKSEIREELGLPLDAFIVLSVGELNKNKNHEVIIRAIAKLNDPQIYYVICGNGPLDTYIRGLARTLAVGEQVKLLGYRRDIPEVCKVADVFAFPSKREGLGLVAIEAMASGLPILTSNVRGITDYSINGVTGFNYNHSDIEGFAEGIYKLKTDEELRHIMSLHNLEAAKQFDIGKTVAKMSYIYSNLCKF